ncbi:MAG: DUF805 domain-containing protein [Pseudomonadota bacterium]
MANSPPPVPTSKPPRADDPVGTPPAPHADGETLLWLFFRFDGRISRQVYWLAMIFLSACVAATGPFVIDAETGAISMNYGPLQAIALTVATICSVTITIKRLHDLNMTGFFALALLVAPLSIILSLWVGIRKGDKGPNKYGEVTDIRPPEFPPGSRGKAG